MATTNPVFQVLVTGSNQAVLTAGQRQDALLNGQIGVFNVHTGLSVDGTVIGDTREIFLAVGINRTSGGTAIAEDIQRSAGQVIQVRNSKAWTVRGAIDEVQKVVEVTGFSARCETDYALKIEFRAQRIYGTSGYNKFGKVFPYTTGCCTDPCVDCGAGDPSALALGLRDAINNDPDKLLTALLFVNSLTANVGAAATGTASITVTIGSEVFLIPIVSGDTTTVVAAKIAAFVNAVTTSNYKMTSAVAAMTAYPKYSKTAPTALIVLTNANGTGVTITGAAVGNTTITDIAALAAAYPGVAASLRITSVAEVRSTNTNSISMDYHKAGMDFIVSLTQGFECGGGVITTITDPTFKDGSGYDINQLEYIAGGWNGKPGIYRQSALTGMARKGYQQGIEFFALPGSKYTVLNFEYDQFSVAGWNEHLNNLRTTVAIPCADTVTLQGLVTILDLIFTQFQPMTNDVAAIGCTGVLTQSLLQNTDGIETLS